MAKDGGCPVSDDGLGILRGKRVALAGRLASMSKREAAQLLRSHGATVLEKASASVDLLLIGEEFPWTDGAEADEWFDAAMRRAVEAGTLEVLTETQLWERLGLVEAEPDIHRLYTPAMLAELLQVPVAVIRRWHRRGLIVPRREVRRLPYFDFQEVATARRLAELLAAGTSVSAIEKKLAALARYVPGVVRPLAQLSVIVEGRDILLRQGDGLVEPGGQMRFDFEAADAERDAIRTCDSTVSSDPPAVAEHADTKPIAAEPDAELPIPSPEQLAQAAAELEEAEQLEAAAEMYRAAMAAGGPRPEHCFQLAELLYRLGDLGGARERYYMAIELDEDYVEARANLGCVLAEQGQRELGIAALEGALSYHADYADAHYHLARLLDQLQRGPEAEVHWRAFLALAPDSPWGEQARNRLGAPSSP